MVNETLRPAANTDAPPERAVALSYAPARARAALAALLALDDTLAGLLRAGREPLVAQMRLTWWHGALTALDDGIVPAQPVLAALAQDVLPRGVAGVRLAGMIDGWETLLDLEPLDSGRLTTYAAGRGRVLFEAAGTVLGAAPGDPVGEAGEGWALADLVGHIANAAERAAAADLARARLGQALALRWSRPARALGAMAHAARMDLAEPPVRVGSPRRVARLLRHRLTGG
ncbi:squalene/phytoene synthase family protein [uncultured Sphingomonas sp.]|uniref:squalene/phytoene synthase family protein n=1 Tax=uncultured Sphingomonas sp. TaxID=158754 RepID=UPI0035CC61D1